MKTLHWTVLQTTKQAFPSRAKGTAKIIVSTYAKAETRYVCHFDPRGILNETFPCFRTCTEENCPGMTGGPKYEYLWQVRAEGEEEETP